MSDDTLAAGAAAAENPVEPAANATPQPVAPAAQAPAEPAAPVVADPVKSQEPKGPWGDDWREKLANGDEKRLDMLKRFASPEALLTSQEEAQRKISEGLKPRARPGEKANDEEWAAYRKEAGIPDDVDGYVKEIKLGDQRQIGDDDKPVVAAFSERALKAGIPPSDLSVMVNTYYDMQEEIVFQQAKHDADFKKTAEAELKEAWGGDFSGNMAAMRPYFETVDSQLFDNLMGGRLADGTKIGNHPGMLKFFATKAVAENPMATVMPTNNGGMETLNSEIATLEKRMGADRDAWFKDDAAQKRLQQLYDARARVASR